MLWLFILFVYDRYIVFFTYPTHSPPFQPLTLPSFAPPSLLPSLPSSLSPYLPPSCLPSFSPSYPPSSPTFTLTYFLFVQNGVCPCCDRTMDATVAAKFESNIENLFKSSFAEDGELLKKVRHSNFHFIHIYYPSHFYSFPHFVLVLIPIPNHFIALFLIFLSPTFVTQTSFIPFPPLILIASIISIIIPVSIRLRLQRKKS